MDKDTKETVLKAVDYANEDAACHTRHFHWLFLLGVIMFAVSKIISHTTLNENSVLSLISDFTAGSGCATILVGIFATSRFGLKLKAFKQRLLKRNG